MYIYIYTPWSASSVCSTERLQGKVPLSNTAPKIGARVCTRVGAKKRKKKHLITSNVTHWVKENVYV